MNKKFLLTAASITIFILILVLLLSPKKNINPGGASDQRLDTRATIPINLSKEKRDATIAYTASIQHKLPLYQETFETSVGITTSIRISRADYDPAEIVHLDINGLSYINKQELNPKINSNITAFKESYLKAIEMLEGQNIDPKKLIFIYGDKQYVRETTQAWINALNLLK